MRKILAIILVLAMFICVLVSCKKDETNDNSNSQSTTSNTEETVVNSEDNADDSETQSPAMDWSLPY